MGYGAWGMGPWSAQEPPNTSQIKSGAAANELPQVNPARLARHRDVLSLRKAYPRGYRLSGALIPARPGAPPLSPAEVDRAMAQMDAEELAAHARPR